MHDGRMEMKTSKWRGNKIKHEYGLWVYCDTKESVKSFKDRDCGKCHCSQTKEGHDSCIGTLKHIMNACCGHGEIGEAFIQFSNGFLIKGIFAILWIKIFRSLNMRED